MQLNKAQALFAQTMLDHPDKVINPEIQVTGLFQAEGQISERLQIYRNNIVGSLTDTLLATYPLIKELAGEEFASQLFRSFILKHPPTAGYLAHYGAGMDEFIASYPAATSLAYLPDVAKLEWAINESYYAAGDGVLEADDFQNILFDNDLYDLRLNLKSSVILVDSNWPIAAIRNFCLDTDQSGTLDLDQGGCQLMVFRPEFTSLIQLLNPAEFHFLQGAQRGKTIGEALEQTLSQWPDFKFDVFLQDHLKLQTFSGIILKEDINHDLLRP